MICLPMMIAKTTHPTTPEHNAHTSSLRKLLNAFTMNTHFISLQHASRQQLGNMERPTKKIRHTRTYSTINTVDIVNSLTGKGIETFRQSNFVEAETYFSQALCRIDVEHLCDSIQASMNNSVSNSSSAASYDKNADDFKIGVNAVSVDSDVLRSERSTASNAFMYFCQRHEYDEGMDVYEEPESVHDTFDADSISARLLYNIGLTKMKLGQYESALSLFEKTLSKIRLSGEKNSQLLLQVLHKMGYTHYRRANNTKATRHFRQALTLAVHESLNRSTVAACLNCLGVIHLHSYGSDTEKLLRLFKQSLSLYRESLGSKQKDIATVLNNIGRVYYLRCEYENALEIYAEALSIRKEILGEDSIDSAATTYNHGQTYHRLGLLDDALIFYNRFLGMMKASQGSNDRDIAIVYRCMGEIYHERGEDKDALNLFKDALKAGKDAHTTFHPEVAATLNKLGNICYEMKDPVAALRYYREGLEIENVVLPPEHPHVIITLTNIAHILKQHGDYDGALEAYTQVHQKQTKVLSPNSIELAATLSSIGLVRYHLSMYDDAFDSYQEALRIRREKFGTDEHPDIASTFNSIGLVLFKQNFYELAINCFEQSLKIRTKLMGKDHRDTAILWYNLATIHVSRYTGHSVDDRRRINSQTCLLAFR